MDDKINITKKLLNIVKNRKTPIVVSKQESGYNRDKKVGKSLSYDSYSGDSEE
jgi:hypothetical protein